MERAPPCEGGRCRFDSYRACHKYPGAMSNNKKAIIHAHIKGYRVTELGEVISPKGNSLSLSVSTSGYYRFSVKVQDKRVTVPVHLLASFQKFGIKAFRRGTVTRHLDSNPLNNSLINISIGTLSDNMMDIPEEVRVDRSRKAAKVRRKLTDDEVTELRALQKQGWTNRQLREKYDISKSTVSYIVNSKTYLGVV